MSVTVTPSGWTFLVATCVVLPWLALRSAAHARRAPRTPTRTAYLASVVVTQGMTLFLALSAAAYDAIDLFPPPRVGPTNLGVALAVLALALGTLPPRWAWKTRDEKQRLSCLLSHGARDLGWWVGVAVLAGFVEEIVYRGVMFRLWQRLVGTGSAVAICVLVFTLVHAVQGWRAMAAIALIAAGAHWIVLVSGDLYTAMVVHVLYDLVAGVVLLRLARRDAASLSNP